MRGEFPFLVPDGEEWKLDDICDYLEVHFSPQVLGQRQPRFPTQRWCGAKQALRNPGLLASIHDLFHEIYSDWLLINFTRKGPARGVAQEGPLAIADAEQPAEGESEASEYARENARARQVGRALTSSHPGQLLLLLCHVLQPADHYMNALIKLSSEGTETKNWSFTVRSHGDLRENVSKGKWLLLELANGTLDKTFFSEVEHLHDESFFRAFHGNALTLNFRHLAYRLISREGAAGYEHIAKENEQFPFPVFTILSDPEALNNIEKQCPKLWDAWTAQFVDDIGGLEHLMDLRSMLEVFMLIAFGKGTAVNIENDNAVLRRAVLSKSLHTQRPWLGSFSASHVNRKARARERRMKTKHGTKVCTTTKRVRRALKVKPRLEALRARGKTTAGGGAWRAVVRKKK